MKSIKRIAAAFAILFAVLPLAACDARVDYYYDTTGTSGTVSVRYDVVMSASLVAALNSGAAEVAGAGESVRWTVDDYMTSIRLLSGYNFTLGSSGDDRVYSFTAEFDPDSLGGDDDEEEDVSFEVKNGFFTRRVYVSQAFPFASLREQFDGDAPVSPSSLAGLIFFGSDSLPAFTDAFPVAKGYSPDELTMRFLWRTDEVDFESGADVDEYGKTWREWTAKFDREQGRVEYSYTVMNPLGYYVVALALGAVVAVIIVLATRKSKREPALVPLRPKGRQPGRNAGPARPFSPADIDPFADLPSEQTNVESEEERLRRRLSELLPPDQVEEAVRRFNEAHNSGGNDNGSNGSNGNGSNTGGNENNTGGNGGSNNDGGGDDHDK